MDRWAWEQLDPWLEIRRELPIGALLCVIHGPTAGRRWEASAARKQLHHAAAGVRRRFAPHRLGHVHSVEMAHEGVPLVVIQRQLRHANLGITSIYLQGITAARSSARPRAAIADKFPSAQASTRGDRSKHDRVGSAHAGRPDATPRLANVRARAPRRREPCCSLDADGASAAGRRRRSLRFDGVSPGVRDRVRAPPAGERGIDVS